MTLALALGALVVACEHATTQSSHDDPNIVTLTASNFKEQVLQSSQPVLVDFWADWCAPCKVLAPTISEVAKEYSGRLKVGKVDVDKHEALVEQFSVEGFPTVLLFKDGKVVDRTLGVVEKSVLQEKINKLLPAQASGGAAGTTAAK
jgi:thioredoxin 1